MPSQRGENSKEQKGSYIKTKESMMYGSMLTLQ